MVKKPISMGEYEKIRKLSYNDFNRWFVSVQNLQKDLAIDIAIREVYTQIAGGPDAEFYAWDVETLRKRFEEMGLARRTIDDIIALLLS